MRWTKRWGRRLRTITRRPEVERELEEELAFHIDMQTRKNVALGMTEKEARRQAVLEFGGVEKFKEEVRESRALGWISGMSLDFRLGGRMLRKYPGLTIIGTLAITFAIWVGVGTFEFLSQVVFPTLPFDDGDRVVGVQTLDAARSDLGPTGLHDFQTWRADVRSIEALGAYRTVERNLITGDGRGEPVALAEISASSAEVTRVPALLGRTLVAADEAPDAEPVAVIGHELWQRRFDGDPEVIGRNVRIGREDVTIVGVMPDGYGFPVAQEAWVPLRLNPLNYQWGEAPVVEVFGRLAPGASMREAQAELSAIGARTAVDHPATHQHLRPRVMPFTKTVLNLGAVASVGVLSMNLFIVVLLLLVCGNVALLMFARAATRESEIVVRNALGASRGRIVAQMFAEALVLAALAGALGLAGASYGLRWGMNSVLTELLDGMRLPFWFHSTLSVGSVVYAIVLTVLAAVIAGVIPALKMTGPGLEGRLRAGGSGGGGLRFGGLWTSIIIVQIAVTVVFPLVTYFVQADMRRIEAYDVGFVADQYLSARLEIDEDAAAATGDTSRAAYIAYAQATREELERRLLEDPSVTGVTLASALPRQYHGWNQIELDEGAVAPLDTIRGHRVSKAFIAPDYLSVMGRDVLSGRSFHAGDVESAANVAIVNEAFVEKVLAGKNPIGRRVRYMGGEGPGSNAEEQPWHEIVGVAPDMGMTSGYGDAGIYHPAPADGSRDDFLIVGVTSDPERFAPALQRTAAAVDPTLRLHDILTLDAVDDAERKFYDFWLTLSGVVTVLVLVLSWAGIYAVMSFTVSRRTREIGIRVAVGGAASRVLLAILRRPLTQVGMGVALGAAFILTAGILLSDPGTGPSLGNMGFVLVYAAAMFLVCLLACIVPSRRALSVEPTEALRAE